MLPRQPAVSARDSLRAAGQTVGVPKSVLGPSTKDRREDKLVRGLLTGVAAFRWLAWAWMAVLLVVNGTSVREPDARSGSSSPRWWPRPARPCCCDRTPPDS
jgi:hypothetical protein